MPSPSVVLMWDGKRLRNSTPRPNPSSVGSKDLNSDPIGGKPPVPSACHSAFWAVWCGFLGQLSVFLIIQKLTMWDRPRSKRPQLREGWPLLPRRCQDTHWPPSPSRGGPKGAPPSHSPYNSMHCGNGQSLQWVWTQFQPLSCFPVSFGSFSYFSLKQWRLLTHCGWTEKSALEWAPKSPGITGLELRASVPAPRTQKASVQFLDFRVKPERIFTCLMSGPCDLFLCVFLRPSSFCVPCLVKGLFKFAQHKEIQTTNATASSPSHHQRSRFCSPWDWRVTLGSQSPSADFQSCVHLGTCQHK